MTLRHAFGLASFAAWGTMAVAACLDQTGDSPYLFDGGDLGACTGNVAKEIPISACPGCAGIDGGNAPGAQAFAQCIGTTYSDCTCQVTCGYTVLGADGTPQSIRGQSIANVEAQGTCCGKVAEEMPAKDCYGCTGSVAYALCDENGSIQCSCACDLPTGYSLIDGGDDADLCDAGPGEGGTEEAGAEAGKEAGTDAHPMGDAGKDGD